MSSNNFARIQPFIEKWEGGYSNHPSDRGGPTNMGITLATLRSWRQDDSLTADDVKRLSLDEARRIYKARYYDVVRGDDLPLQVAAPVYNGAVLHGTGRSAEFLQNSLVSCGAHVDVDRVIGPDTLGAIGAVDVQQLSKAFLDIEDAYFRRLPEFPSVRQGLAQPAERYAKFRHHASCRAHRRRNRRNNRAGTAKAEGPAEWGRNFREDRRVARAVCSEAKHSDREHHATSCERHTVPSHPSRRRVAPAWPWRSASPQAGRYHHDDHDAPDASQRRVGTDYRQYARRQEDAFGIIGSVLTALLGAVAPAATTSGAAGAAGGLMGILSTLGVAVPYLQPIMLGLTAWGALGKFDKWRVAAQAQAPKTA